MEKVKNVFFSGFRRIDTRALAMNSEYAVYLPGVFGTIPVFEMTSEPLSDRRTGAEGGGRRDR